MAIAVIPNLTHLRYIRKGKCNRCGWCCLNEKCEHFEMGEKIATCKTYGSKDRPIRCVLFPEMPPILHDDCGYYFLDTWEDNKVVKGIV